MFVALIEMAGADMTKVPVIVAVLPDATVPVTAKV
jgi:hypothetical protein